MRSQRGLSLIETMVGMSILAVAGLAAAFHVSTSSRETEWIQERAWAREKAVAIVSELRADLLHEGGLPASSLDRYDDKGQPSPVLSIRRDFVDPDLELAPDHPLSGNSQQRGDWRWWRRISVSRVEGESVRDLRRVTVDVHRRFADESPPGTRLATVSTLIRTVSDARPCSQTYDVYAIAIENAPAWWSSLGTAAAHVRAAMTEIERENPGLELNLHWITRLGYGRDEDYAPYINAERASDDATPWAYGYPGRLPDGSETHSYYESSRMYARRNEDGVATAEFVGDLSAGEPFEDLDGNGVRDGGEPFTDLDGDARYDAPNAVPYAMADQWNHCMRHPEAAQRFADRVEAGLEDEKAPPLHLLLDDMIARPARYRNAIILNLHGELLPLPPVRNYSDPARDPAQHPGWRVVAHPERIVCDRDPGAPLSSTAPRFRVHAFKTLPAGSLGLQSLMALGGLTDEPRMTQQEPFLDLDGDGKRDLAEPYEDWNGDGEWSAGVPLTLTLPGDVSAAPDAALSPSFILQRLPGGTPVADLPGVLEPYRPLERAPRYPESWVDQNLDGHRQVIEPYFDQNGNGQFDAGEPWQEIDGDGAWSSFQEVLKDENGNGRLDLDRPAEPYVDANGNGQWDGAEPYVDVDGDGDWTPPSEATPIPSPWDPALLNDATALATWVANNGEPYLDVDGNGQYDVAETLYDTNGNGVRDGGFERAEMWYRVTYDAASDQTILSLYGTPLETPTEATSLGGLLPAHYLYDLEYIPCPTPDAAGSADRYGRDLASLLPMPKNTGRWVLELPTASLASALESAPGASDGLGADRRLTIDARIGSDLTSGSRWPVRNAPQNLSRAHTWIVSDPESVPFSERYQFQGDPRHCPYEDLDRAGSSFPNGYNWWFDDFTLLALLDSSPLLWPAFEGGTYTLQLIDPLDPLGGSALQLTSAGRLSDGWAGGGAGVDVPRYLSWFRTALQRTGALYTSVNGAAPFRISLGGDVGGDATIGHPDGVPVDGTPYGIAGTVYENTLGDSTGTPALRGSTKLVQSVAGADIGLRLGGAWWSKPWIGELCPDEVYASQWVPSGNLSATDPDDAFRRVRRGSVPSLQQPAGTALIDLSSRLGPAGVTAFHCAGGDTSTVVPFFEAETSVGTATLAGQDLLDAWRIRLESTLPLSRPFTLTGNPGADLPPEFAYTDSYPRQVATAGTAWFAHQNGSTATGLIHLTGDAGTAHLVWSGTGPHQEVGSARIARLGLVGTLQGWFESGRAGIGSRVERLPQACITSPTVQSVLEAGEDLEVVFDIKWTRWDGEAFGSTAGIGAAEPEDDLRYRLLVSKDSGRTWTVPGSGEAATPGELPRLASGAVDTTGLLTDLEAGQPERYVWAVPEDADEAVDWLVRVECWRDGHGLHHAWHEVRLYFD